MHTQRRNSAPIGPSGNSSVRPRGKSTANKSGKYQGWLLKKATSVSAYLSWSGWRRRFCVIHDDRLEYFLHEGDNEPRGVLFFGTHSCKVKYRGKIRDKYESFNVEYGPGTADSVSFAAPDFEQYKRWESILTSKFRKASLKAGRRNSAGERSGSTETPPMLIEMEVTSRGHATDVSETESEDDNNNDDYESRKDNVSRRDTGDNKSKNGQRETKNRILRRQLSRSADHPPSVTFASLVCSLGSRNLMRTNSNWELVALIDRQRFFRTQIIMRDPLIDPLSKQQQQSEAAHVHVFKSQGIIHASASRVFRLMMDMSPKTRAAWDSVCVETKIERAMDVHNDVISFRTPRMLLSLGLGVPHPVASRKFQLERHWRQDLDDCYEVLMQSTAHNSSNDGVTSHPSDASLSMVWRITPTLIDDGRPSCVVTQAVHINLGGWVWPKASVAEQFAQRMLVESTAQLRRCVEQVRPYFDVAGLPVQLKQDSTRAIEYMRAKELKAAGNAAIKPKSETIRSKETPEDDTIRDSNSDDGDNEDGTDTSNLAVTIISAEPSTADDVEGGKNRVYRMPPNTNVFPMSRSPKGRSAWWDSGVEEGFWKVRGPKYFQDKRKVPNDISAMELLQLQWSFSEPIQNICKSPDELVQQQHQGHTNRPFLFVVNFMVPHLGNLVLYFAKRVGVKDPKFDQMLSEFVEGTDEHRNRRFKIIPNVVEGGYMVKRAIGSTPAILGKKIKTEYFKGDNWFEVCVDVSSSKVAGGLMGVVKSYASTLVIDFAFLIESQAEHELPERLIGGCRMHYPNVALVKPKDMHLFLLPEEEEEEEEEEVVEEEDAEEEEVEVEKEVVAAVVKDELVMKVGDNVTGLGSFERGSVISAGWSGSAEKSVVVITEQSITTEGNVDSHAASTTVGIAEAKPSSEPNKMTQLNYTYSLPPSSNVFPRALSLNKQSTFSDVGTERGHWKVRGASYLSDNVKVASEDSAMELLQCQWSFYDTPKRFISLDPDELIQRQHVGNNNRPFIVVVNFMVPTIGNLVLYFARRRSSEQDSSSSQVFDRMLDAFMNGTDEYRNNRFKIIPQVVEGYYIVKRGVGSKPAILGRKIRTEYHLGDNFFEICVDVGSSRVAGTLMSLVRGYASTIVMDLAFLFEAKEEEELPERVLGAVRLAYPLMQPPKNRAQYVKS